MTLAYHKDVPTEVYVPIAMAFLAGATFLLFRRLREPPRATNRPIQLGRTRSNRPRLGRRFSLRPLLGRPDGGGNRRPPNDRRRRHRYRARIHPGGRAASRDRRGHARGNARAKASRDHRFPVRLRRPCWRGWLDGRLHSQRRVLPLIWRPRTRRVASPDRNLADPSQASRGPAAGSNARVPRERAWCALPVVGRAPQPRLAQGNSRAGRRDTY
jgi:hypothetical protein